jgi:hypothetical protein
VGCLLQAFKVGSCSVACLVSRYDSRCKFHVKLDTWSFRGRPPLAPLSPPLHRLADQHVHALQDSGFEPETMVVGACGSINPWLKPFDRRMFSLMMCRSGWLALVFVCMQVQFGPERPGCQAGRPRRGRSAWVFPQFGQFFYSELMESNKHLN